MASLKELYGESLKTGKFTVNYQFFGSPTIVAFQPEELKTIYSDWDDRVIRGGLVNAGIASARDTARITKFFTINFFIRFKKISITFIYKIFIIFNDILTTSFTKNIDNFYSLIRLRCA